MPRVPAEHTCYLALGSNLNEPLQQIRICLQRLNCLPHTYITGLANLYQSKPWGIEDQPDFINTVVKINTSIKPLALLKAVKIIEYRLMQRQVNQRWHSRVIDIDLLLWDTQVMNRDNLTLPHPFIAARCFVLRPLLELSPDLPIKLKQQINHQIKPCVNEPMTLIRTPDFIKNQLKLL